MADDEVLSKKGPELFKELLRLYPGASLDDYYQAQGNTWRDDVMRIDWQLISAHRKEAGAPEPPDLEDIVLPKLPQVPKIQPTLSGGAKAGAGTGPSLLKPSTPVPATRPGLTPTPSKGTTSNLGSGAKAAPAAKAGTGNLAAGGPAAELRLIALFVSRWKLDPTKTKMMLAKLGAAKRKHVIQNFKPVPGRDPTAQLQMFIQDCDKNNSWGSGGAGAAGTPTTSGPKATGVIRPTVANVVKPVVAKPAAVKPVATAIKRPIAAMQPATAPDASKRPRMMAMEPKAAPTSRPANPAAQHKPASSLAANLQARMRTGAAAVNGPRPPTARPTGMAIRPTGLTGISAMRSAATGSGGHMAPTAKSGGESGSGHGYPRLNTAAGARPAQQVALSTRLASVRPASQPALQPPLSTRIPPSRPGTGPAHSATAALGGRPKAPAYAPKAKAKAGGPTPPAGPPTGGKGRPGSLIRNLLQKY